MTNKAIATAITAWRRCIILSSSEKIRRFLNLTGTCLAQVDVHVQSCANARVRLCATRLVGKKGGGICAYSKFKICRKNQWTAPRPLPDGLEGLSAERGKRLSATDSPRTFAATW